ncbi:MAG: hypothetical protein ACKESB_02545, partial [Candidatus Hodgkinia cicadicola]
DLKPRERRLRLMGLEMGLAVSALAANGLGGSELLADCLYNLDSEASKLLFGLFSLKRGQELGLVLKDVINSLGLKSAAGRSDGCNSTGTVAFFLWLVGGSYLLTRAPYLSGSASVLDLLLMALLQVGAFSFLFMEGDCRGLRQARAGCPDAHPRCPGLRVSASSCFSFLTQFLSDIRVLCRSCLRRAALLLSLFVSGFPSASKPRLVCKMVQSCGIYLPLSIKRVMKLRNKRLVFVSLVHMMKFGLMYDLGIARLFVLDRVRMLRHADWLVGDASRFLKHLKASGCGPKSSDGKVRT